MDVPWQDISKYFLVAIRFIKEALSNGGKVLVHCYAGVSRSATIVIAYLMQEHNLGYYEAMTFVKRKRPEVFPNAGF